jgi:hypothetical protein
LIVTDRNTNIVLGRIDERAGHLFELWFHAADIANLRAVWSGSATITDSLVGTRCQSCSGQRRSRGDRNIALAQTE